jgi:hypothetical protein
MTKVTNFVAADFIGDTSPDRMGKAARKLAKAIRSNGNINSLRKIKNLDELEEILRTTINNHGQSVMHLVALNSTEIAVKIMNMLKKNKHKANVLLCTDDYGVSPLLHAKKRGLMGIVNALLNTIVKDEPLKEGLIEAAINAKPVPLKVGKSRSKAKQKKNQKKSKPKQNQENTSIVEPAAIEQSTAVEKAAEPIAVGPTAVELPVIESIPIAQSDIQDTRSTLPIIASSSSSSSEINLPPLVRVTSQVPVPDAFPPLDPLSVALPLVTPLNLSKLENGFLLNSLAQQILQLRTLQAELAASLSLPSPRSTIQAILNEGNANNNPTEQMIASNAVVDEVAITDNLSALPALDVNNVDPIFSELSPTALPSIDSPKKNGYSKLPRSSPPPINYSFARFSPRKSSNFDWAEGQRSMLPEWGFSHLPGPNSKDADGFSRPQLRKWRSG